jgi:Na+/melibiose symporter-like transporter
MKILYACLTNILLMTLYSANNTPYSALSGVMTGDGAERTVLSSYRFVAAMVAQLIVGGVTLPLVAKFGHGNSAVGWQKTMTLWAVVCVVCFIITFLTTRERIQPPPQQKSEWRVDFKGLLANGPWIAMFVLTLSHFIFVSLQGGSTYYYFSYYVDHGKLLEFLQRVGLPQATAATPDGGHPVMNVLGLILAADHSNVASVGYSLFNIASKGITLVGIAFATYLAMRFGKRAIAIVGFLLSAIALSAFILLPSTSIEAMFGLELVRALMYAPTIPLLWAMFADTADYAEWKTGRRSTGVIFATILFALKTGLSIGGAISGLVLSVYGYQPNTTQTPHALLGIRLMASVFPAIFLVIAVVCLIRYRITKSVNEQMSQELAERRRGYSAGVSAPGLPDRGGAVVATN